MQGAYGDLVDESGMLSTALIIVIKDCGGKELYRSGEGRSKQKDFQKGYYESLREASASLQETLNYTYSGKDPMAAAAPQPATPPVEQKAEQPVVTPQPQSAPAVAATPVVNQATSFAQPITNGYQLVDTTPKVVTKNVTKPPSQIRIPQ